MALISIKRNVDLQPGLNAPVVFNCSQGDKGTTIMLGLMNGGNDYTVPSGVTITIRGSRSNGAVFTPTSATFSGSTVSFTLTEEMTDTAGPTLCEAVLEQGNNVLGTANFIINVEGSPMGADVPPVFTDAAWAWMLGKLTTETVPALGDDVISSIQGKVDKSQGSTNAKKFLRVNTSGNVSLASTDKTLSVADQIADAKETGDQIRTLDAEIDDVATTLGGSISTLNGITTDLQSSKLNKNQGASNAGKVLMVNQDGTVSPAAVDLSGKASESTIAPEFDPSGSYTAGSYVYKNGVLYRFASDHAAGAWTGTDAEVVTVGGEVTDLKNNLNYRITSEELYTTESWSPGYLGTARPSVGATSNSDYYTPIPVQVYEGETIDIKFAYLPITGSASPYLYYAWCDENGAYVGSRNGPIQTVERDDTYKYVKATITVPADGYIMLSYRNKLDDHPYDGISHAIGSYSTSDIKTMQTNIAQNSANIAKNTANIAQNTETLSAMDYLRFPSDYLMPINVCHRGLATAGYPENTLIAFKDCKSKGWKWVETDVRRTSDGVFVLLHDATINRTARNADGTMLSETINISDITYAQALTYDFGIYAGAEYAGEKIVTLDEFLNLCNKADLFAQLEIKESDLTQAIASEMYTYIDKYRMGNKIMYLSSSNSSIKQLLKSNPYVPCCETGSSTWNYHDPSEFDTLDISYLMGYSSGKNKVFYERIVSAFASIELQDNFIDFCRWAGVYAGTYCPTTEQAISGLSNRFDIVCSQFYKYTDVKSE